MCIIMMFDGEVLFYSYNSQSDLIIPPSVTRQEMCVSVLISSFMLTYQLVLSV